jgi:phospholipid-translocating ATPase
LIDREARLNEAVEQLEVNMELLAITGVEDKLQEDIQKTLGALRNAGIKI